MSIRTKHKKKKGSVDISRSQSSASDKEENLEDQYVADTRLGIKKDIFGNLDLKCTSHGISFSKDDDDLKKTEIKSPTQQRKGPKHKIRAVMPLGPFDGEDELIQASLRSKTTSPKKTQSKKK